MKTAFTLLLATLGFAASLAWAGDAVAAGAAARPAERPAAAASAPVSTPRPAAVLPAWRPAAPAEAPVQCACVPGQRVA